MTWNEIHRAEVVYIQYVRYGRKSLASYLVKYFEKDLSASYRFWCSWGWVFRGFVKFWHKVVVAYMDRSVRAWVYFLRGGVLNLQRFQILEPELYKFNGRLVVRVVNAKLDVYS